MGVTIGGIGTWLAGFAGGGTAAAGASTAAIEAGGYAAVGGGIAAGAAPVAAAAGGVTLGGIISTAGEVAAIAQGASSLYSLAQGPGRVSIPPTPGQVQVDQSVQNVEQQTLKREQAAGGLQGSTGTPGGQAGAVLNPGTVSNRSILGG